MTGSTSDPARQIEACRKDLAEVAVLWQAVAGRSAPGAKAEAEAQVFNQMVVVLDKRFTVASGGGITGVAAAQEVRLLARGVAQHGGWFPEDSSAQWRPDASVTGYHPGDRIALNAEVFSRLAGVFLDGVARNSSISAG